MVLWEFVVRHEGRGFLAEGTETVKDVDCLANTTGVGETNLEAM